MEENPANALLQYIEKSQIGYDAAARSAYGTKPGELQNMLAESVEMKNALIVAVVYADYTASGR